MLEGMAVVFAQRAFSSGTHMGEYQPGGCLGSDALEVGAIPCRNRRGEEARSLAQLGVGIKAYSETVRVILAPSRILD